MSVTRRVLVSLPADQWLTPHQNDLKWGIVDEISRLGYLPEIFTNPRGMPGLAAAKAWSAVELDNVVEVESLQRAKPRTPAPQQRRARNDLNSVASLMGACFPSSSQNEEARPFSDIRPAV
jgi:hypothetical protein